MKLISLARSGSRGTRADLGIGVKIRPTNRSRASARLDPKAHVLSQKAVSGELQVPRSLPRVGDAAKWIATGPWRVYRELCCPLTADGCSVGLAVISPPPMRSRRQPKPPQLVGRPPFVTSSTVSEMIEGSMRQQTKTCALFAANLIFVWLLVEGFRLAHGNQKIRPLLFTLGLLR
jgi:hypothetical protein